MSLGNITDFITARRSDTAGDAIVKKSSETSQMKVEVVGQIAWLKADRTGDSINLLV